MNGDTIVEESLETMIDRIERQMTDEEQTELDLFEELERALPSTPAGAYVDDEFIREDEFTCLGCHMILHRTRMADRRRRLCAECSA